MAMPRAMEATAPAERIGKFRWTICGLLFLAATINYIDRQVIGILKPTLQAQFGWTEIDYGDIVFAFQMAYAIGYLFAGRVMDLLGIKRGFALALTIWSLAAMGAAAVPRFGPAAALLLGAFGLTYTASVAGFIVVRFVLGLGESGNFPAAIKTVAEWFPQRERAFATGLFNAGTNIGAVITPMTVPFITARFGWDVGVRADRRVRVRVARRLARDLREARSAHAPEGAGARVHLQRSGRARDAHAVAQPDGLPADVVVRRGEVPDRSDLVDVSVLAARLLQPQLRSVAAGARTADHRHLRRRGRRQRRRRLVVLDADPARLERERGTEDGDARAARSPSCRSSSPPACRACGERSR